MAAYREWKDDSQIVRTLDEANIPNAPGNADWDAYQDWLAAGNIPDPWIDPVSLEAYTAAVRFSTETSPLMVGAMQIAMDRLSQERTATIVGSFVVLKGKFSVDYKAMNGFFSVNEALAKDMQAAVQGRIQTCFTREKDVLTAIAAGTITTKPQIDAAFADMAAPLPLTRGGQAHGTAEPDEPATEPERRARGAHADRRSAHADHRAAADAGDGAATVTIAGAEAEGEPAPAADRADAGAKADAATARSAGDEAGGER